MRLIFAALSALVVAGSAGRPGKWPINHKVPIDNATGTPPPPSQDPWYSAPAGYERARPGDVLKIRNATGLVAAVTNSSAAYNILYRTTNGAYKPAWAVTTIFLPLTNITRQRNRLLSYQIPYDSADVDSSPSYSLYQGGGYSGDADITAALGRGLIVNTPDYEGPNAYFTAGVFSGHATIDAVRAVLSKKSPIAFKNDTRYAMWGYSGGALASEWAAELQVQYAPELNFAGAALGGLTPNVTSVLFTINGTVYAGLAPAGVVGLLTQYPESTAWLNNALNPTGQYNASRFFATKNYTLIESIAAYGGQDIGKYFKDGSAAIIESIPQKVANKDGLMGYHGVPQIPLFVYKAIGDDISKIADTDFLVNRYCAAGATINYQRNTVGNHLSEGSNGDARAVAFLNSVLSGTYNATGCQIANVTVGG